MHCRLFTTFSFLPSCSYIQNIFSFFIHRYKNVLSRERYVQLWFSRTRYTLFFCFLFALGEYTYNTGGLTLQSTRSTVTDTFALVQSSSILLEITLILVLNRVLRLIIPMTRIMSACPVYRPSSPLGILRPNTSTISIFPITWYAALILIGLFYVTT